MPLAAPDDADSTIERQWTLLASPGDWLTGAERVAVAGAARGETTDDVRPGLAAAARRIHDEPATITLEWLDEIRSSGVTDEEYVEVIGVVARLRAIDTFEFGLGRATRPLPESRGGDPGRPQIEGARLDGGWVPTIGPAFPLSVLSLAPSENDAMLEISEALYLAPRAGDGYTMGNQHVVRDGLTRSQMEFVAARTSLLNDCFY